MTLPNTRPEHLMPSPTLAKSVSVIGAALAFTVSAYSAEGVELDPKLTAYTQVSGISGNLNSIGSDTLNNLMTFWAEGFSTIYPNVNIGIEGKGSSTAPPALIQGTAQFGPMSREMSASEIDRFETKFGYKPTQIRVAIDALAVFVHKDNPITGLTLQQIDGIFSSSRKRGGKDISLWSELGLKEWQGRSVSLYGRNSASGTYGFFKENALAKGDYKATVKEQPGSSSVVQGVASDLNGIGYSGIGYVTASVKALPLGEKAGELAAPTYKNCLEGTYPLARFLYVYINRKPGQPIEPLTLEFIKFMLSKNGQESVIKEGYYPLTAEMEAEEHAKFAK